MITQTRRDCPCPLPSSSPLAPVLLWPPGRSAAQPSAQPTQVAPVEAVAEDVSVSMPACATAAESRVSLICVCSTTIYLRTQTCTTHPAQGDVPTLVEHDLRLETRAGPVQHWWPLEIDPIHLHLGGHLPSARLVNSRRGLGPHHRCRLLSTWPGDQCKGNAPWSSARSADHREVL